MDIVEIESLVKNLKSVINCRISADEEDNIKEVHVVANESRSAKQISRDVQSIIAAVFNSKVDYKKISVAQIKQDDKDFSERKLKIKSVERATFQYRHKVKVTIEKDKEEYSGECSGMNNSTLCLRQTGEAAVLAIEEFMQEEGILSLDDLKIVDVGNIQTVVVALTVYSEEKSMELCGSHIMSHDPFDCVVRAVLDAIAPISEKYNDD